MLLDTAGLDRGLVELDTSAGLHPFFVVDGAFEFCEHLGVVLDRHLFHSPQVVEDFPALVDLADHVLLVFLHLVDASLEVRDQELSLTLHVELVLEFTVEDFLAFFELTIIEDEFVHLSLDVCSGSCDGGCLLFLCADDLAHLQNLIGGHAVVVLDPPGLLLHLDDLGLQALLESNQSFLLLELLFHKRVLFCVDVHCWSFLRLLDLLVALKCGDVLC